MDEEYDVIVLGTGLKVTIGCIVPLNNLITTGCQLHYPKAGYQLTY